VTTATLLTLLGLVLLPPGTAGQETAAGDWSRFRGPNGSGVIESPSLPLEFGPGKNVIWKAVLPPGHSSPVLSRDRIFLTASEGAALSTFCLDRSTGAILWRRQSPRDREEKLDERNSPASPTPATDGENLYVFFGDYGLLSYDGAGDERWRLALEPFTNAYGMGSSPVVVGDKVILVCDQSVSSFMIAVGKDDGRVRWGVERPESRTGHSTPVVYQPPHGPLQLLVPGSFHLTAYAAETGEKIWWVSGLSFEMKCTPAMGEGLVYVHGYASSQQVSIPPFEAVRSKDADGDGRFSRDEVPDEQARSWFRLMDLDGDGYLNDSEWSYYQAARATSGGLLAFSLGGRGDMTGSNFRWRYDKSVPQLPSSLYYRGVLHTVNDNGILTAFRPVSGEVLAQGRIRGAIDKFYASPVAADGKIFLVSESGKVAVLKTDGSLVVLALNDLEELCYATPAIADGRIYIRTRSALYCFGELPPGEAKTADRRP
jgi:outer membrane protein assembly factor BamB